MTRNASLSLRLLVLWGAFIVYGTTIPFELTPSLDEISAHWERADKIPWIGARGWTPSLVDAAANLLLFLPWGFLLAVHLAGRRRGLWFTLLIAGLSSCALSSAVELFQLLSPVRRTSATDVFNNTIGGILGACVGWLAARPLRERIEPWLRRLAREQPLTLVAAAVATGVLVWALAPFDFSIDVDDLKRSIKSARLWPFGPPLQGTIDLPPLSHYLPTALAWILVGASATAAARARGLAGVRLWSLLLTGLAGLALTGELVQVITPSRVTDMTSVAFCLMGGLAGAGLAATLLPDHPQRLLDTGITILVATLLVAGLEPWNFELPTRGDLRLGSLVPFLAYFQRTDVYALADALIQIMAFLPLGVLVALRVPSLRLPTAAAFGAALALVLEIGQLFLPGRYSDITDVILAAAGALIGAWLISQVPAIRARLAR